MSSPPAGPWSAACCFLDGYFTEALLFAIFLTQLWRIVSETLCADFRGFGKISAYQKMGALSALYMLLVTLLIPGPHYIDPNVVVGWSSHIENTG
ncbi:MAG: hypothetical protein V2B20_12855 [Pseudomonadota bacterium]